MKISLKTKIGLLVSPSSEAPSVPVQSSAPLALSPPGRCRHAQLVHRKELQKAILYYIL